MTSPTDGFTSRRQDVNRQPGALFFDLAGRSPA
jgi:hypothetical protein